MRSAQCVVELFWFKKKTYFVFKSKNCQEICPDLVGILTYSKMLPIIWSELRGPCFYPYLEYVAR